MFSVTGRIKSIKQPDGAYLSPKLFNVIQRSNKNNLYGKENIKPYIVGRAVEYLTRFHVGTPLRDVLDISYQGYKRLREGTSVEKDKKLGVDLYTLASNIKGLDDNSIIAMCKIVAYDSVYREGNLLDEPNEINPDNATIFNIREMVMRSIDFWNDYGKIVATGFTFSEYDNKGNKIHDGYSKLVSAGDGDFLTKDTLWDFKVIRGELTGYHTLQLLMYWIMGVHSEMDIFKNITKLGVYNPRLNKVYIINTSDIPYYLINDVEDFVICY